MNDVTGITSELNISPVKLSTAASGSNTNNASDDNDDDKTLPKFRTNFSISLKAIHLLIIMPNHGRIGWGTLE